MHNKETILSQGNLQDFIECPRRFQLGTLDQISWPSASSEPLSKLEHVTELGVKFHAICHRYFSGIGPELIRESINDPDLLALWEGFLPLGEELKIFRKYPEVVLSTNTDGYQITAKYDLIVEDDSGIFRIYDWKTSPKKPARNILADKTQTILYPFIFSRSGAGLFNKNEISPASITMNYFYPLSDDPLVIFNYSPDQVQRDTELIRTWIDQIDEYSAHNLIFPLTDHIDVCSKCSYRSICDRGREATDLSDLDDIDQEDLSNIHFDLDQIMEIEF